MEKIVLGGWYRVDIPHPFSSMHVKDHKSSIEILWVQRDLGVLCCNLKLLISVINYASQVPLKNADNYPSLGCHNVWHTKNEEKKNSKKL